MKLAPFAERLLAGQVIVTDGSIETELARRLPSDTVEFPPCIYNVKNPVLVETIHREFIDAGATLIHTNTEHANRLTLERHNLADKVYEFNRKGVWTARCAALHRAHVAGVIGPVGKFLAPLGTLVPTDVRQAFIDQAIALVDGGADVIALKSFIDLDELELAIDAVKFVAPDIPIIALKTFPEDGAVLATSYPADVARRLIAKGVAALGANGTVGPQRMMDILKGLAAEAVAARVPLVALPDIGIPTLIDGKAFYNGEPSYVAASVRRLAEAGALITGAEGGATIEHIRAIAGVVADAAVGSMKIEVKIAKAEQSTPPTDDGRTLFARQLGTKFVTTVELDVPRGLDLSSILEGAQYLKDNGIDAVNISDGARARLRMSSIAISQIVQSRIGIECHAHLACRDRNMIGLQSEVLGAHAMGVKNILAVTGDPTQIGDYPYATSVYDVDAIGLIRSLGQMNKGRDLMGNPIGSYTQFCIGSGCNPVAYDMEREVRRLRQKAEQGAHVTFSQPIFDIATLEAFLNRVHDVDIHFILGVIPLRSARHADFLHHEVPGMDIPDWVRKRIHDANAQGGVEAASQEGIRLTVEFLRAAKSMIDGVYLMPPFKKYSMAVEILREL
jgi:methionine synthase / methylenetetrahydrofolate reductase(NADPH)